MLSLLSIRLDLWLRTVLCLLLASITVAQQLDSARNAWRWTQFTANDGLPSSRVARIYETERGIPWALTERGLAWFDDFAWRAVVDLPRARPSALAIRGETLFVVTGGRLFRGGATGFSEVGIVFDGLKTLSGVVVCADGSLMLEGESENGPCLLVHAAGQTRLAPPIRTSISRLRKKLIGAGGVPFVCHVEGIDAWSDGVWQRVLNCDLQPNVSICVAAGEQWALLLRGPMTHRGLWTWSGSGLLQRSAIPATTRLRSVAMRGGDFFCLDSLGRVFCRIEGAWRHLTSVPIETGTTHSIGAKANGDLWFGSESGAILYLGASDRWTFEMDVEDPDLNSVHEILHARDGSAWIATRAGLIHEVSGQREVIRERCGRRLHNLTGLAQDADGDIWVSSGLGLDGVLRLSGGEWRHFGRDDGLEADHVHKIRADRSGSLWFCGIGSGALPKGGPGIFGFDGSRFARISTPRALPCGRVYDFAEGPDGTRWFATYAGIARWSADGAFKTWLRPEGEVGGMAFAITADKGGAWFANRGRGLGRIEGDSIRFLTEADGLSSNRVWNVEVDLAGGLWIATELGLDYLRDGAIRPIGVGFGLRRLWPLEVFRGRIYAGTQGFGYASLDLAAVSGLAPRIVLEPLREGVQAVVHWQVYAKGGLETPHLIESRSRINSGAWSAWDLSRSKVLLGVGAGTHEVTVEARSLTGAGAVARHVGVVTLPARLIERPAVQWSLALLSFLVCILACSLWTRRRHHQLELAARAEGYRDLFENAQELIYTLDLDGCITSVNRRAEDRLGAMRSELIGTRFAGLVVEDSQERIEQLHQEALDGGGGEPHEFEVERVDCRRIWLEISSRAVSKNGVVIGTQNFARDISARRQLEQQLLHAQKMEAVGRLAGGIAHDFNNLLVVIKGFSEMLLTDLPDISPARKSLEQIRNAGQRAALLTRQLLAFSRKEVARPEVLDLSQSISDMEDLIRRLVGADVEVEVEIDPGELCVFADPSQMEQVVMNLVVNSRDAMPDGGLLSIELRAHRQAHSAREGLSSKGSGSSPGLPEGDYISLSVTDTGGGMSADLMARVFEPFFTTKEQGKGTGLGLSIVYGIVQQSGGHIDVQSNLGEGARFSVHLPMSVETPLVKPSAVVADSGGSGSETILLVEDELAVRKFIKRSLEQRGYKLLEAEDGRVAMEIARDHDGPIHILLTDVVMPRMGGAELARQMAEERPATKILFLSGYPGDALSRYGLGDEDYLQKPFAIGDLTRKLRELVSRDRRSTRRDSAG